MLENKISNSAKRVLTVLSGLYIMKMIIIFTLFWLGGEGPFFMDQISLIRLKTGDCCRVQRIVAGANATRRLYEMGFNTGARVRVLKNDSGPLIVGLEGNKIALGRGLAEKMLVTKLEPM